LKDLPSTKMRLAPLCPCRHYEDKVAEVHATFWNCPCTDARAQVPLYAVLTRTNGDKQEIPLEIKAVRNYVISQAVPEEFWQGVEQFNQGQFYACTP